jgi:hypothetical protein
MSSSMTKREGGIGLESPAEKPLSKLPMILSVARKVIVGLPGRVFGKADCIATFRTRSSSALHLLPRCARHRTGRSAPGGRASHRSPSLVPGNTRSVPGVRVHGQPQRRVCATNATTPQKGLSMNHVNRSLELAFVRGVADLHESSTRVADAASTVSAGTKVSHDRRVREGLLLAARGTGDCAQLSQVWQ